MVNVRFDCRVTTEEEAEAALRQSLGDQVAKIESVAFVPSGDGVQAVPVVKNPELKGQRGVHGEQMDRGRTVARLTVYHYCLQRRM